MHINTPDLLQNGSPRWLPRGPPDPSSIYSTRQVGRLLRPALPRALELKACASMSVPECAGCGDERKCMNFNHVFGTTRLGGLAPIIIVRMQPNVRRDLACFG